MLRNRAGQGIAPVLAVLLAAAAPAAARPDPACPAADRAPVPAYAEANAPPNVTVWRDFDLRAGESCAGLVQGRQQLVVALAARFRGPDPVERIAARLGAVSATAGLVYWSTTDGSWRTLISDAAALRAPDPDAVRPDFSAAELLSGRTLYFRQQDTRSTGWNLYSLRTRESGPGRLVVEMVNLTAIRYLLLPLFGKRALVSVHLFDRLGPGLWGYYGLSAVRDGAVEGYERSFVNRAAAFYRFVRGMPGDAAPPLAP